MTLKCSVLLVFCAVLAGGCHRGQLSLSPAVLEDCGPGPGKVIRVDWDARQAGVERVDLALLRPGGEIVGWGEGPAAGSKSTGPWASDGLTFILLAADGRELDRRTVTTIPCRNPKPRRR